MFGSIINEKSGKLNTIVINIAVMIDLDPGFINGNGTDRAVAATSGGAQHINGTGTGESLGDSISTVSGNGATADSAQFSTGDGSGDEEMGEHSGRYGFVSDRNLGFPSEISWLFQPWTPETILHAYAYMNATSQEEKDVILGVLELAREYNV